MKGLLWVFFERGGVTLLSLFAMLWYATVLGPSGYGEAAIVLSVVLLVSGVQDNIQRASLISVDDNLDVIFFTSLLGWLGISIITSIACVAFLFWFLDQQALNLVSFAVFYIPISSCSRVLIVKLLRGQEYKSLALRSLVGRFIGILSGMVLALLGHADFAIIAQSVISAFAALIIMLLGKNQLLGSERYFDFQIFISMFKEGLASGVKELEQNAKTHGVVILLGGLVGTQASGAYALAVRFVDVPRVLVGYGFSTWVIGRLRSVKNDFSEFNETYQVALFWMMLVMVPAYIGLALISTDMIAKYFGDDWSDSSFIIKWLSLYYLISSLYLFISPLQIITKTTNSTLLVNLFSLLFVLVAIIVLADYIGIYSALVGMLSSLVFILPKYAKDVREIVNVSFFGHVQLVWFSLFSGGVMFGLLEIVLFDIVSNLYLKILVGAVAYMFMIAVGFFISRNYRMHFFKLASL